MKKTILGTLVLCGLLALGLARSVVANSAVDGDEPAMMASPQTVVLAKVTALTIHTNIPYGTVQAGSLALNGVAPTGVGVDSCGHIVARFAVDALGLQPGSVVLKLTGTLTNGVVFAAEDVVTVK